MCIRDRDGRAQSWWGESYAGVCRKSWQFSCWNKNDPNYAYLSGAKAIPAGQFSRAQKAADMVMSGQAKDPACAATHYYAITMPKPPVWAKGAKEALRLGHHIFFTDVP